LFPFQPSFGWEGRYVGAEGWGRKNREKERGKRVKIVEKGTGEERGDTYCAR